MNKNPQSSFFCTTLSTLTLLGCILIPQSEVYAAVIASDWLSTGDSQLTHDQETGLQWLDVTQTVNLSQLDVFTLLESNPVYDGFRYATVQEFNTLANHLSLLTAIDPDPFSYNGGYGSYLADSSKAAEYANALRLLGITYAYNATGGYRNTTLGILNFGDIPPPSGYIGTGSIVSTASISATFIYGDPTQGNSMTEYTEGHMLDSTRHSSVGSFLVRDSTVTPVPEPPSLILMASGLLGLFAMQRRKGRQ